MNIPAHLPEKLTISLWDFTWYTRTTKGEPFENLDTALEQAVQRGYNTIRICAAPLLLFGDHHLDTSALRFVNMGGDAGQRTRWYDVSGGAVLDLKAHLLELFRFAKRHGVFIIISSWEYQQSPAFLEGPEWHDMLTAIPARERHEALARAESRMLTWLHDNGLRDRVAYVEIHNEVDLGRLREVAAHSEDTFWAQKPYLVRALDILQQEHPEVLSTVCYGIPPYLDLGSVPENAQVAHAHLYIYGVLGAIESWAAVRAKPPVFPTAELKSLLRDDAPDFDKWTTEIDDWRLVATGISTSMFYTYDWVDTVRWDSWLYEHYQEYRAAMREGVEARLRAIAVWARNHNVPAAVGEGWIGYTPLDAEFEDGPAGQTFARFAVDLCKELGYWGTIPGSNSAPHHPSGWRNISFQQKTNDAFRSLG